MDTLGHILTDGEESFAVALPGLASFLMNASGTTRQPSSPIKPKVEGISHSEMTKPLGPKDL